MYTLPLLCIDRASFSRMDLCRDDKCSQWARGREEQVYTSHGPHGAGDRAAAAARHLHGSMGPRHGARASPDPRSIQARRRLADGSGRAFVRTAADQRTRHARACVSAAACSMLRMRMLLC